MPGSGETSVTVVVASGGDVVLRFAPLAQARDETGDGADDDEHGEDEGDAAERHAMDGLRSAVFRLLRGCVGGCGFGFQSIHGVWMVQA